MPGIVSHFTMDTHCVSEWMLMAVVLVTIHVSVTYLLMRGEFDDHLTWPFQGDVNIQLVNQLAEDRGHFTKSIHLGTPTDVTTVNRVIFSN